MSVFPAYLLLLTTLTALTFRASGRTSILVIAAATLAVMAWDLRRAVVARGMAHVGAAVLHTAFLFWFGLPGFMTALSSDQFDQSAVQIDITNHDALLAYVAVSVTYVAFMVARRLPWASLERLAWRAYGAGRDVSTGRLSRWLVVVLVVGLSFYFVVAGGPIRAISFLLRGRDPSKPWAAGANLGTEVTPFKNVAVSLLVLVAAVAGAVLVTRKLSAVQRMRFGLIFLVATVWVSADGGTRSFLIGCVLPPGFFYVLRLREAGQGRRLARGLVIGAAVAGVLVAANIQRSYRTTGTAEHLNLSVGVPDNDFLTLTAFSIAVQRAEGRFLAQPSPYLLAVGPVPRVLWSGKPIPESSALITEYIRGYRYTERGGNNLPSIVGGEYLNWGWPGVVILGFALGMTVRTGDRFFERSASLIGRCAYLTVVSYLFISFRGLTFGFFFPVPIALVACWLVRRQRQVGHAVVLRRLTELPA